MSDFAAEFLDMMPDTVTATPGVTNEFGDFIPSGSTLALPCRVEGESRLIRDQAGREVVSSIQIIVGGVYNLTTHSHRYTLPTRYNPRLLLTALTIELGVDEEGPTHEIVMLP